MIDERTCAHEHTADVEVPALDTDEMVVVARLCTDCMAQLPAAWGCVDCNWVEHRALCDPVRVLMLAEPCAAHRDS